MDILGGLASLAGRATAEGVSTTLSGLGDAAIKLRQALKGAELSPDKMAEIEKVLADLEGTIVEAKSNIIVAEAQGKSWLQRNWRPLLMTTIIIIVANNYVLFPYLSIWWPEDVKILDLPDKLFTLMEIGVGGYIVSRGAEKILGRN